MNIMGYAMAITFFVVPVVFIVSSLPLTTITEDVSSLCLYGSPSPYPPCFALLLFV